MNKTNVKIAFDSAVIWTLIAIAMHFIMNWPVWLVFLTPALAFATGLGFLALFTLEER